MVPVGAVWILPSCGEGARLSGVSSFKVHQEGSSYSQKGLGLFLRQLKALESDEQVLKFRMTIC